MWFKCLVNYSDTHFETTREGGEKVVLEGQVCACVYAQYTAGKILALPISPLNASFAKAIFSRK